jgi:hypothetical protein
MEDSFRVVVSRLAARLVTGPVAFFVAGVIDISAFAILSIRQRLSHQSPSRH